MWQVLNIGSKPKAINRKKLVAFVLPIIRKEKLPMSEELEKLYKEKVTPDTINYENFESHVQRCPHFGSVHFVKNSFNPKHRQKYRCKDCRSVFMSTTGTMFTHSRTSYD